VANSKLDTFEAVMQAMDKELGREKRRGKGKVRFADGKGKGRETAEDEMDIEKAMDAELRASMREDGSEEEIDDGDYQLIKNFLTSFQSQGGLGGPVSSLVGRLEPGLRLPRD